MDYGPGVKHEDCSLWNRMSGFEFQFYHNEWHGLNQVISCLHVNKCFRSSKMMISMVPNSNC